MPECKLKNVFTRSIDADGGCRAARLNYIVSGVPVELSDPGAGALEPVRETAPAEVDGAPLALITLTRSYGNGVFEVQAEYEQNAPARQARKRIGEKLWIFDTTGGREEVFHGELLRARAASGEPEPPDPGDLIRWNGRNGAAFQLSGVSRIVSSMRESCIAVHRESELTGSFRRRIMELTGCVTSRAFHSWEPGEVLFLGASGSVPFRNDQGVLLAEVTYRFAIRRNVADLRFAGVSLGRAEGWHVPWSITSPDYSGDTPRVLGAYLSSVYEKGDFSRLKLE